MFYLAPPPTLRLLPSFSSSVALFNLQAAAAASLCPSLNQCPLFPFSARLIVVLGVADFYICASNANPHLIRSSIRRTSADLASMRFIQLSDGILQLLCPTIGTTTTTTATMFYKINHCILSSESRRVHWDILVVVLSSIPCVPALKALKFVIWIWGNQVVNIRTPEERNSGKLSIFNNKGSQSEKSGTKP